MRESALLIEVPEAEPLVAAWRLRHDSSAAAGVPAHVTVLYPFRGPDRLGPAVLDQVEGIAASVSHFDFVLSGIDEFRGVLWLRPDPDEPFRALTAAVFAAFADCAPYGGRHPEPQPHLTVAEVDGERDQAVLRAAIEADLGSSLPLRCEAVALALYECDDAWVWRPSRRFAFA